jgi:hypothetical protein
MVMYGNLSKQKISLMPREIYTTGKKIKGLMLFRWLSSISAEKRLYWFNFVAEDLATGGKIFGSTIIK